MASGAEFSEAFGDVKIILADNALTHYKYDDDEYDKYHSGKHKNVFRT